MKVEEVNLFNRCSECESLFSTLYRVRVGQEEFFLCSHCLQKLLIYILAELGVKIESRLVISGKLEMEDKQ